MGWVVYLRCNNPGWACTASMISDTWVLTAAHCVDGCYEWTVQAGSNLINGQDDSRVTIDTTVDIRHPGFNFITLHDDVAVIQLPEPVPLSDTIRVGCLPGQSQLDDQFEDDLMTLTGWGITCDNGCGQPNNMNFAKDDSRVTIDTTVGIRHPGFNFINLHDDVAVIQLPEPVPLSDTIRVGCLPGQSQLDDQFEDDLMTLTGWGITC